MINGLLVITPTKAKKAKRKNKAQDFRLKTFDFSGVVSSTFMQLWIFVKTVARFSSISFSLRE
jgi:hypothetical protein